MLLSCSCKDPKTNPKHFRWTHVESSGTEVSSQTLRYKDRVHTFHKTTPSNLSLLISNLTEDDQGTYRCTVNNKTSADTRLIVKGETLNQLNDSSSVCFSQCFLSLSVVLQAVFYPNITSPRAPIQEDPWFFHVPVKIPKPDRSTLNGSEQLWMRRWFQTLRRSTDDSRPSEILLIISPYASQTWPRLTEDCMCAQSTANNPDTSISLLQVKTPQISSDETEMISVIHDSLWAWQCYIETMLLT